MNCKFINVLVFAAGAAIGSAVTYKFVKKKYERIAQEEIDSVKETFSDWGDWRINTDDDEEVAEEFKNQIDWDALEDLDEDDEDEATDEKQYGAIVANYTNEKGGVEEMAKEPYVISPYDFGEMDGYNEVELTYYADEILEDDEYNIITDVEKLIGKKALTTFGEYEDDSVFVRNEHLKTDFQILKDYRTYDQARSTAPGRVNNE